jgi:hypothetical protein
MVTGIDLANLQRYRGGYKLFVYDLGKEPYQPIETVS